MGVYEDFWRQQPPVARKLGAAAIAMFVAGAINPQWIGLFWNVPGSIARLELWRPITSVLSIQSKPDIGCILTLYAFYTHLSLLEQDKFKRQNALLTYLITVAAFFVLVGPYLGFYAYLSGLSGALTYTVCQSRPREIVKFFYVIDIQRQYLPWVNLVVALITGGTRMVLEALAGIFIAHLHMFVTEIVPIAGGPVLVPMEDDPEELAARARWAGSGRRLGQ